MLDTDGRVVVILEIRSLTVYHNSIMTDSKLAEFEPPQACINRLIKTVLPSNVQITKDSRVRNL